MSSLATLYRLFADSRHGDEDRAPWSRESWRAESSGVRDEANREDVERLKAGDVAFFERLFEKHYLPLRRFARMILAASGNEGDVVEDVFAWLWESRARLDIRGSLESYLYSAVRHRALNVLRNERKQFDLQARFAGELEESRNGAQERNDRSDDDLLARIRAVIASLPERRRLVLTLRWESGLGNAEIAEILGIAPQSVANLVQRALADLRAAFPNEFR